MRVNPLETCGREDLAAVLAARPDVVMMSKVATPEQVHALEHATGGSVDLVPNIETAAGLVRTFDIVRASPRVTAALVASEDMVADLGTARSREGAELAYVRARFLVECRAAGSRRSTAVHVQRPAARPRRALREAAGLSREEPGRAAAAINRVFTPQPARSRAQRIVAAFEKARAAGRSARRWTVR